MKNHYPLKNRVLALLLSIVMVLGMLPTNRVAATGNSDSYGTVSMITSGAVISDNTTAAVSVEFKDGSTVAWSAQDFSIGRYQDGWWAGIKITAPASLDMDKAQYYYNTDSDQPRNFSTYKDSADGDSEQYINMWIPLNDIINGSYVARTIHFDWDGDGTYEQTITVDADSSSIVLLDEGGNQAFPFASVEMITEGAVITGNYSSDVQVNFSDGSVVAWYEADTSIGRYQDGWWAGIKITAPVYADAQNAKYYYNTADTDVRSFWSYKDSADNAQEQYINMWIPLNDIVGGSYTSRTIHFDWDNDGTYEQTITVDADPGSIILTKDSVQVYPALASVSGFTGGTVSGDTTGEVTVHLDSAVLDWDPADPAIGRTIDAWWVGIKVTAPSGMTEDQLKNAVYQSKGSAAGDWSASKSFWSNKDSVEGASEHYIGMWLPITPDSLAAFIQNGKDITMWYQFDWDNDGVFEQSITFSVDPNGVTLNKKAQTGFAFSTAAPADVWIGVGSYQNEAIGGQGNGEITYEIIAGDAYATIADDGTLTFGDLGTNNSVSITVQATKAADSEGFYNEATAQYTITVYKEVQHPQFTISNPSEMTYAPGAYLENPLLDLSGLKGTVSYEVTDGVGVASVDASGKLTILKAGTVTVTATVMGDGEYTSAQVSYTVTIEKASQTDFAFETPTPSDISYNDNGNLYINAVVNAFGDGKLVYSIVDGTGVASIDADTGELTILKAGTVEVQAQKKGDDCYKDSEIITYTLTVLPDDQDGFGFTIPDPAAITYNDNGNKFENSVVNAKGEGTLTYSIVNGSDVAVIDAETGELTILKAGEVTVKVEKAGDARYNAASATYTLTVKKADQALSFTEETVDRIYGIRAYTNGTLTSGTPHGEGALIYEIIGNNTIGASIDPATGELSFVDSTNQVGSITVKVTRAADDCYNECYAQYTFTLAYQTTPSEPYFLSGETLNSSGWYTGEVTISAPAGYQISYSNALSTSDWDYTVAFGTEGANQETTVYLKDANGYITDAIPVTGISIDLGDPGDLKITYAKPTWEIILETITFGIYQSSTLNVTVSAVDSISGIESITYDIGEGGVPVAVSGTASASHSFTIDAQYRNRITFTVTDVSGRQTKLEDDRIVVLDTQNPDLTVSYQYTSGSHCEVGNILYTQEDTNITFTLNESNFDLSGLDIQDDPNGSKTAVPVVEVNGIEQLVSWTKNEGTGNWEGELTLTGNGDYVVTVTYVDPAGNAIEPYEQEIHIDDTTPILSVTYDNIGSVNGDYYNADRTATIRITAHNFRAEDVELTVEAKDITGVVVAVKDYTAYAKDSDNWSQDGNVWTLDTAGMKLDTDARYTVTLNYTDLNENEAQTYSDSFVIDKTAPEEGEITIEYSISVVDRLLELVTFGFYQADVTVTVTAEDITAGVAYFDITYTQENGANTTNTASYTAEKITANQNITDKSVFTASYTIPAEARGTISVTVTDWAGWTCTKADSKILVVDNVAPGLDVKYTFTGDQMQEQNGIFYTQGETTVQFTIDEANFDLTLLTADGEEESAAPTITVNSVAQNVVWTQVTGTNQWVGEITLVGNGDYAVAITFSDRSGNLMESFRKEIHIDDVAPVLDVTYDNNEPRNTNYYNADRTAAIQITEHNFNPDDVKLTVTAVDITGEPVDISTKAYAAYAKDPANWTQNGDAWTLNTSGMVFDIDAIYFVELEYTDLAGNQADAYTANFVLDQTGAANIEIEYSASVLDRILEGLTFGFYQAEVVVTVTAEDMTAGVEYFELTYTRQDGVSVTDTETFTTDPLDAIQDAADKGVFTATYKIPAQARGTASVAVMDKAGNNSSSENAAVIVVDDIAPTREVIYTPYKILDAATLLEVDAYQEGDNAILYYKDEAAVTFQITEANFDLSLKDADAQPVIQVNGTPVEVEWTQDGDVWTAVYTITGDGDYVVTLTYKDLSSNEMVDYESCKIVIDGTAPVIDVKYENGLPTQTQEGVQYYKNTQTVSIQITDHSFRADDVVLTVTAKDITGADVDVAAKAYAEYAKNRRNWISDGDVHTLNLDGMVFDVDAIYTLDIVYDDICDNFADDYAEDTFVIDHNAPENLTITYSTPVIEKVIEKLTFGFYEAEVAVTITCDDITAGVDFFEWSYTKQADASDVNAESYGGKIGSEDITYSEKDQVAAFTIKLPADARGHITAAVTDRAGNSSNQDDDTIINIVDKIAPDIFVEYTADSSDTKVQFVDGNKLTVESFDKATDALYNGNVTATIIINEANFFEGVLAEDGVIHQVGIKLTKTDDDGNVTVIEYLPAGAAQKYADAKAEYITWADDGDSHTFSISYADNADYILEIEYTDLSANDAGITANDGQTTTKAYTSKTITVDKVAPVVQVVYSNTEALNTIGARKYFDKTQSATITVTEHNFRAADMVVAVTAVNFLNADVPVADYAAQLADEGNWTHEGNVHTAVIHYTVDANYTFDIDFADLAQNASADYAMDLFTVDTTAPTNLTVSYSTNVFQEILESITFGYYNATMTVTISADDPTTGIYHFAYSYTNGAGVSGINAELLNQAIASAEIKYDGITGTASFDIPRMILGDDNQFNGTVQFTAYDRSENNTELRDSTRLVVDNISPTATITYNDPVQNVNDVSYYAGNIEATIAIEEANFDSGDVIVTVTKDGASYPVDVTWTDNSVDHHTGIFTLTEDGDYYVSVQYKDKSGNKMADYKSNELTLDTTAPVIKVTNIKANSANKDSEYGFAIEFSDTNLDANSMKPVLQAVIEKANGVYEIVEIDLGEADTVAAGQTYTYTVENLPDDGLYTLVCEVKDLADNITSQVILDDGQSYGQVSFSINRNGSAFGYGSEFTEKLVGQYYVYSVDSDVVIVEVNVDPVEDYTVSLNGKELVEGTDYSTEHTSGSGEWSKRTYTIRKELFEAEGEYSIIVTSTDKANTTAFSDVKNLAMAFVVDQTKPVLTITGLESGGRYQTDEQTVTIIPTDEGGRLNSLSVIVLDSDGNPLKDKENGEDISVRFDMSGEELLKYLEENDGKVTFTIPDGLNNKVKIICNDCAVNAEDVTNEYNELFENVTVSQSWFIIFYANRPAFFGTFAGILAFVVVICVLIKRKKDKKAVSKA